MRVTQTCRAIFTLVLVFICSTAVAKPGAKKVDILSMMPDNSLAFVVVNDPALLFEKAETLAKQLEAPIPEPMALLQAKVPATEHIDMARPAAVTFTPDAQPLGGVVLIPVTDFEAFVKACGAEDASADLVEIELAGNAMVAASYQGYALLADVSSAASIEGAKNNQGKVAEEYTPMRQRMEAADITGGATQSGIKTFATFAKQGIASMQAKVEKLDTDELSGMPANSIAEIMSIYTMLVEEFEATVQSYAFVVNIEKKVITSQDILRLKKCELATILGQAEPFATDWCGQLPAGRPVVVMAGAEPKSLTPELLDFWKKAMLSMRGIYGMDEGQIEQLTDDFKSLMEKTDGMAFLLAVPNKDNAPLYAGTGGILKVDGDVEQYIDDYTELFAKMGQAMKKSTGDAMFHFPAPRKIEVDGKPGVRIIFDFDLSVGSDDSEQQQMVDKMIAKMYGPDGLNIFLVAANEDTVAFGYTSQATVKRFVAAANGELPRTLGSMPAYKALKAHLPDDVQWGGALDLGGYLTLIQRFLKSGIVPNADFPNVDVPPSPIGLGVTASDQEVCIHGVVTVKSIKQLVHAFMQVISNVSSGQKVEPAIPASSP